MRCSFDQIFGSSGGGICNGQALIFGFSQSASYVASNAICCHKIECITSKAAEKTTFMVIMFSVALLSGLLTLLELCTVLKSKKLWEKIQNRTSETDVTHQGASRTYRGHRQPH
ncbi:gap junction delta-3 protein-like [Echeneis naucrates]|uniref:gap junction delta-3 protein-like n=1 Tax=Echeneis naucrates TaxID=173247 RepID=UPI0011135B90|nr:gap junction delta-3 protein-like [Echeneis naucrates]XP_029377500.1 gap junction delta-3 protein-like [Echeneis naucrates]